MGIQVEWGSATHVGHVRSLNQDATLAGPNLFIVADGMGGHAAGEVASAVTVARLASVGEPPPLLAEQVVAAVLDANRQILDRAADDTTKVGMGTTVAGVALVDDDGDDTIMIFNVGDSRVYQWHQGLLSQVSLDHSVVGELVRDGSITVEEARQHPSRNVVTRALGVSAEVEPDVWLTEPIVGDRFLVCSDGLTNEVAEGAISSVFQETVGQPQDAAEKLLTAALDHGARDNVSVVVVDILGRSSIDTVSDDTNPRPALTRAHGVSSAVDATLESPVPTTASEPQDSARLITGVPSLGAESGDGSE